MKIMSQITSAIVGRAVSKIASNETVVRTVENAKQKAGATVKTATDKFRKAAGIKTAAEIMAESEKQTLLFKSKLPSLSSITALIAQDASSLDECTLEYDIYDANGKFRFRLTSEESLVKSVYTLYDSVGNEVGYIEEPLFSVGVPLLEKDVRKCTVYLGSKELCTLKRSESLDGTEWWFDYFLDYSSSGDTVKITHKDGENIRIRYGGRTIARIIDVPLHFDSGYYDAFVLEYGERKDEKIGVLLSLGIKLIS